MCPPGTRCLEQNQHMSLVVPRKVAEDLPRGEYPRPQFVRPDWLCLNGRWEFEAGALSTGDDDGPPDGSLARTIVVPFCPESTLSGIGEPGFMNEVWYRKTVVIPESWAGRSALLHFQAVDHEATVWVNGVELGSHRGGFTPFSFNLAGVAEPGDEVQIVVRARDDSTAPQARGKQSRRLDNFGCFYTRTTGIWQTVWMEPVPTTYLCRPKITADAGNGLFRVQLKLTGPRAGARVGVAVSDEIGVVDARTVRADHGMCVVVDLFVPDSRRRLWSPASPFLYDLDLSVIDAEGQTLDRATSYAGLRDVAVEGGRFLLNGRPWFQKMVLDQGYWPDGLMTAPTEDALRADIQCALAAGFNGGRLHQKVVEERYLYWADRLGYAVWAEFPDWGSHEGPEVGLVSEWLEVVDRDVSHPSIIGWCALNEFPGPEIPRSRHIDDMTRAMFLAAKSADPTRPVLDASGWSHRVAESDVYDVHDYEQDPAVFAAHYSALEMGLVSPGSLAWRGQPLLVSEFGGIGWAAPEPGEPVPGDGTDEEGKGSWWYGTAPRSPQGFIERFSGLCAALLDNPHVAGYCYTQLTDTFQERNGLYTNDRKPKFQLSELRNIQSRPPSIEVRLPDARNTPRSRSKRQTK